MTMKSVFQKITFQKVIKGFRYLKHYGFKEFVIRLQEKMEAENIPYEPWYARHKATAEQLSAQKKMCRQWKEAPLISIVVPLYGTPEIFLREMIASVQAQSYENWQLCLSNGYAGDDDKVDEIVKSYMEKDNRIVMAHSSVNLGIADNTNAAAALAEGEWIAFMDHDDLLAPDALFEAVKRIREGAANEDGLAAAGINAVKAGTPYDLIYTDEDKVDMDGKTHFQPHFKPDMNIDLLRSNNYITHFTLVRRELFTRVGGIRKEFDGAQDYDFILRCVEQARAVGHIPRILYHWRCHQASTSENPFSKQYAVDAGRRAVSEHLKRLGIAGEVSAAKDLGFYSVKYEVQGNPLISFIIPNKDEVESLKKCLASIQKSDYTNYEVIIAENNSNEDTFSYYRTIAPEEQEQNGVRQMTGALSGGQRILVAVWKEGFNYSKLNNFGASHAKGDYLVLMNNDIELMGTGTLRELLGTCQRNDVGIVGAKLYYPDDTVQHAGIVVGIGGNARGIGSNMFNGLQGERSGYLHKASLQMDYSAVTAALLMVKKEIYNNVGGFEEELAVAFNDVDFCLKVRREGFLVVYNPYAKAYHYESKSRGAEDTPEKAARFQREIEYMRNHWIYILKNGDPYYNPNFSSVYNNYSLKDNS